MAICGKYSAGMLSEIITFQRETLTSDGIGGSSKAWATIAGAPTRATVRAMSGFERAQADRTNAGASFRIVVRYWAGLREADSVLIRGRRHNITFINNVDLADRWLEIDATGGVAV
jgi:SPP1 family predicted phage head-tail adaptor